MHPRVTAVLVSLNGAQYLPSTLAALAAQTTQPDSLLFVDAGSNDASAVVLADAARGEDDSDGGSGTSLAVAARARLVTSSIKRSFGDAVVHAMATAAPAASDDEWIWLLGHDNAPGPGALAALLGAVEVAPSVAVAGPKLMRLDDPHVIASFGETLTPWGNAVSLVEDELDQAQHDQHVDLLAVAAGGMLVRRTVFAALEAFDPALPSADAALDFCVRVRLAGHRIVGVPTARVGSAGPAELFGRRSVWVGAQTRIRRSAQLHRRMVWASRAALPFHWLSLLPFAILRSIGHIIAKRPGAVGGELAAAFSAATDSSVTRARARLRRNRTMGWPAVDALRLSWAELRERRSNTRAASRAAVAPEREGPGFFVGGGAWVVLVAAIAGFVIFGRFVNAQSLSGGALLPLSGSFGELWSHVGFGWRDVASGFLGPADPFAYVLAVLGTTTFWSPSLAVVILYLLSLPLAAAAAWLGVSRFTDRAWPAAVAAIAWSVAPPFLTSLDEGQLGAVIVHILLPILVLAIVGATRRWSMAAIAALVFAAVAASSPSLAPALVVMVIAWAAANPRGIVRTLLIPLPAVALFTPLVLDQFGRGTPLALLADPGLPTLAATPTGPQLALGGPATGLSGWDAMLAPAGTPPGTVVAIVVALATPLLVLALLSLFLKGTRRSVPALVIAILGFVTAVVGTQVAVEFVGAVSTPVYAAPALSLYWLGLVGAMAITLDSLRRFSLVPGIVTVIALVALGVPLLAVAAGGAGQVREGNGRLLPAFAAAEAMTNSSLGTLVLTAQAGGGVAAGIVRGAGTTLDEQSTLASTARSTTKTDVRVATLAGNLASRSGFDIGAELDTLQLQFVLVPDPASTDAESVYQRITEALDGDRLLTPIGSSPSGTLWNYAGIADREAPSGPGPLETDIGRWTLFGQGLVFLIVLLLAIPTTRRHGVRAAPAPRHVAPGAMAAADAPSPEPEAVSVDADPDATPEESDAPEHHERQDAE